MISTLRPKTLERLNWLAILISAAVFMPFYIQLAAAALVPLAPMPDGLISVLPFLLVAPFFLVSTVFFSNGVVYSVVSATSLVLGLANLTSGHPGRLARIASLVIVVAVLGYPVLYRYTPPLSAAAGYRMQVVTQPKAIYNIVKMSQVVTEKRPCQYSILGWSANSRLYYQTTCGEAGLWRYDPATERNEPIMAAPDDLAQVMGSEDAVLKMVRADSVRPKDKEPITRPLYLQSKGYLSPDGQWTAVVTQHVYGPQDIVVITPSE